MSRPSKLSDADRLKLSDLVGKTLPHGEISRLARELNVAPATVWKIVRGKNPQAPRRRFEAGSTPPILGTVPESEAPPRPESDPEEDPNLRVLRELRDDPSVAPADRVRSALALLGQGEARESAWVPPVDESSWAGILVEVLKVQPAGVRARVWEGRPKE